MDRETRAIRGIELRAADVPDETRVTIDGYASVTNVWYDVHGGPDRGGWREMVQPGAFSKTLDEQRDNMMLLFEHDGLPIAGVRNGTLELAEDDNGLRIEARIDTSIGYARDVVALIQSGLIDSMSYGYWVPRDRQTWNRDRTERRVHEVRMHEVSVVKWPANPATVTLAREVQEARAAVQAAPTGMSVARAKALTLTL